LCAEGLHANLKKDVITHKEKEHAAVCRDYFGRQVQGMANEFIFFGQLCRNV
jgi:hypothetical protein